MSFISVVVCKNYLNVMADGRAVELYKNGDVHRVLEEDRDKIILITDNMFIAITGIVEDAEDFIQNSNLMQNILDKGLIRAKRDLDLWFSNNIHHIITDYSYRIIFGGISTNDDFKVYEINSESKDLCELVYEEDHLSYSLSGSKVMDAESIANYFISLCRFYNEKAETMLEIQAILNDYVADNDISVNKNKKWFSIKKDNDAYIATKGNWNI